MQNQLGYNILNEKISKKIFGSYQKSSASATKINEICTDMESFGVQFPIRNTDSFDLDDLNLPPLRGETIKDHYDFISNSLVEGVVDGLEKFFAKRISVPIPKIDLEFVENNTEKWIRYSLDGVSLHDEIPDQVFVYDCETFVKGSRFAHPIIATAVSSEAYYLWVHDDVFKSEGYTPKLPRIGNSKIAIAHNAAYDHRRVQESYRLDNDNFWVDTMSAHINVAGLASAQRFYFIDKSKYEFEPKWASCGSMNSLVATYNHHVFKGTLGKEDKELRDIFVQAESLKEIREHLEELIGYAFRDVRLTFELAEVVIPKYLQANPSRTTMVAHGVLHNSYLPVADNWHTWLENCENLWSDCLKQQTQILSSLAMEVWEAYKNDEIDVEGDPWLSQLDWSMNTQLKKDGTPRTKWYGIPKWLKDISKIMPNGALVIDKISTKTRASHLLLRLKWEGEPLFHIAEMGWCIFDREASSFKRIPHPKTEGANVGNVLSKDYYDDLESGVLSSDLPQARELLNLSINVSYWTSVRSRVLEENIEYPDGFGVISPAVVPHNTVTNRGGCNLWFTVPDPRKDKIGSEVKTQVQAPKGYVFVQSDYDSQEQVIASTFADAHHGILGSTAFSHAILVGKKENGTDAHSMVAKAIGISRAVAKACGYSVLYGAGAKTLANTIRRGNKNITMQEAMKLAKDFIKLKKGRKSGGYYAGGSDSLAYNEMERIANSSIPVNPLNGTKMSTAIRPVHVGSDFFTMRQNWVIQSTGSAMLHAFITGMEYLLREYNVWGKFCISIHDSITYMCREEDAEKLVALFQVAHVWSWAWLRSNYGLYEMPLGGSWFSSIEVDKIMRKSATTSVVTISNPSPKPDGRVYSTEESLKLLETCFK